MGVREGGKGMNITDKIPIWTVPIKHEGEEYKYWCADYEAVEALLKAFKGALVIPPKEEEPMSQQQA